MKFKRTEKKLSMHKLTVANLDNAEMQVVEGGIETEGTCSLCYSGCGTSGNPLCGDTRPPSGPGGTLPPEDCKTYPDASCQM